MRHNHVGLLGATSLVGSCILQQLVSEQWQITAFSRKPMESNRKQINWVQLNQTSAKPVQNKYGPALWICVAPIWTLPEHFSLLLTHGAQRIVILSSTSRFSKTASSDSGEQAIAQRLADAEETIEIWAKENGIEWIILRPTLIYGLGSDKNISEIARFIIRFGFFPLLGPANGLRQPIHAKDVATACILALNTLNIKNRTYNLTGGETLTYQEMINRVFSALNKKPHFIRIPRWLFQLTISVLNWLPRYRHWTTAMAERMNRNLVFDSINLQLDLRFQPGSFILSKADLPLEQNRI
ncbi:NAD-dependent epimerase/dehydratase family protein [Nitrosomonas sp.]|uniref:NAD-dependent epimerase/dehydratase family protein n=1 Tax=Nitrosomonas sp. TaxID=42353 RepID=UPI0028509DCF|nr:NAD-dependent epimerase/dehydratase family protein [Nitrosomonas sp.]MDR4515355.1 NAD-dependent epimerase/dehydratase family protein [Nitrosomonas sp.]